MADLHRAGLDTPQTVEDDDLLSILNKEAQEAVRRIADHLHLPHEPRSGPERSAKYRLVCQAFAARRERKQFFDADLFGEPVWDLLLLMYREHLGGRELTRAQATQVPDVPPSTAARWIGVLERRGLVSSDSDDDAGMVKLTGTALTKLEAYMEELRTKSLMRVI